MGYVLKTVTVSAMLGNHNDELDRRDREEWETFLKDLARLTAEPRYSHISLDVD